MTKFSKHLFPFWKEEVFSFLQKQKTIISKSYQTYPNAILKGIGIGSVGVKTIDCGINGGLNESAPTGESRHIRAVSPIDEVDISIVSHSELNRNRSVRYYV